MQKNKKMKKIILLLAIIAIAAASFGFYYYNKPRSGVSGVSPAYITDAKALFEEYTLDENAANAKYLGKALEVYGMVKSVETDDRGSMNVMINTGNEMGTVNCQFEKQDEMPVIAKGNAVLVKGFCSGLLMDVVLVDCELITEKK